MNSNEVSGGEVDGSLIQARSINGGVHIHPGMPNVELIVPRQLPAGVTHFVGRQGELEALDLLLEVSAEDNQAVPIAAIVGMAGIGKSALAIQWARRAADRFPDGQLYVNLGGFDPRGVPVQPADVIRSFLDAFQVPAEAIPVTVEGQTALFRSLVVDRRLVIVLDNARDVEQVRPLLPGSPSCLVIITSRSQLSGLVAGQGARPISLDVLSEHESIDLLSSKFGRKRVTAEEEAVAVLINYCARLPLALAIVAARAAEHPDFPLRVLAEELANEKDRLDFLDLGDVGASVRVVFSWSYHALPERAATLFRLLGRHPCVDVTPHGAANLAGISLSDARKLLSELSRANLLDEYLPRRYRFHDLLRAYAAEQAVRDDPGKHREALHRLLDFYLHTSFAADQLLDPGRAPIALAAPKEGVSPKDVESIQQALDWFTEEHVNLLAVTERAGSAEFDIHAWQLPWTLATYFYWRGYWQDVAATQHIALIAAERLGDPVAQSRAYRGVGRAYTRLKCYDDAVAYLENALLLCKELDDKPGQAAAHHALSVVCDRQGLGEIALTHATEALRLSRATANIAREARALNDIGWCHARLGAYEQAIAYCQEAETLFRELNDRHGQAQTLDNLGYAQQRLARSDAAIASFERSVSLHRELENRYSEAATLIRLGDVYIALGDRAKADEVWKLALEVFGEQDHPEVGSVVARLRGDYALEPSSEDDAV